VGEHRLAGARLAGDDVQPRRQAQLGALDQEQVLDAKLEEHARTGTTRPRRIGADSRKLRRDFTLS
jgi:hypothetical protein